MVAKAERSVFKPEDFKVSEYPKDFIPAGAKEYIGHDIAEGLDWTVKGFYLDGEYHIQEIIRREI